MREAVIILALLGGVFWVFFPWRHGGRWARDRFVCRTNLQQIALALKQYGADNDERFPSLQTVAGWRDAIAPYAKDAIFQCPGVDGNKAPQNTDYWFNARLSGAREASLDAAALTVSLGDGYSTSDPRVALSQLPKSWLSDPKSPARRHLDGLNLAFADGHAKWLRPDKVTTQPVRSGGTTFSIN